ncbi:DNA-directed RNA polymerase subunit omega [Candidatus Kinetoplastibacterium sorsogonicusi]|uniref:DNA-directed RNA polymerase subunit omega n=1 Tax=Candidatus Kinetoplastidibacterium kentomonadis TaxID=1576550 RepID=A0A3Q8EU73_9PROT|nr:DNA-directed RNA polymerase subunit omega [Candidatus Kinetoplastibacterium sorsogonicusi]AWD32387.1 DNA-directed RNA polymerase subunit omega [Candidatus Kinetoplastibacterium sorsogonicusi]
MDSVTIESCLKNINNRFILTLVAAHRARELVQGHAPKMETKNKYAITALKEISNKLTGLEMLDKLFSK